MSIKWGVLGTAGIAKWATIPGMQKAEGCELYAVAGRSEEKAKEYKEKFGFQKYYVGYDALLEDPEVQAIYIPLPNHLHCEWTVKALKAGKHVLCEKPLAMNEEEVRKMFAAAKENKVILMEAYAYLHNEFIAEVMKDLKAGIIGKVDYVDTAFLTQFYSENVRLYKEQGGGGVYDVGCYCTSLILKILEATSEKGIETKPVSIMADAEFSENGVDVLAQVMLRFENGMRATFHAGMNLGTDTNHRYDRFFIHGSRGYISSDVEFNQSGEIEYTVMSDWKKTTKKVNVSNNYMLEVENLNRAIMGIEEPDIGYGFSLANAKLLDAVLKKMGY